MYSKLMAGEIAIREAIRSKCSTPNTAEWSKFGSFFVAIAFSGGMMGILSILCVRQHSRGCTST